MLFVVDRARLSGQHDRDAVGIDPVGDTKPRVVELIARVEQRSVILRAHQPVTNDRIQ